MADSCCLRSLLTLLHALMGLGAGFFCLYSLITWNTPRTCLPSLIDRFGSPVEFQNGLPVVCDSVVYGMGAVCFLNFLMCLVNNCLWENLCVVFFHTTLTTLYIAFAVLGGAVISVYYMVWCDALEAAVTGSTSCNDAALIYDMRNVTGLMSSYKSRMEIQMVSILALFPFACMALLTYSLVMRIFAKPDVRNGQFRYLILQEDETTPLVSPVNVTTSQSRPRTSSNI